MARGMMMNGDVREQGSSTGWCILRMSGGNTIPVAKALERAGFGVWTPIEVQRRRVGCKREIRETPAPITPGIVFARHDQIDDLVMLSRSPSLSYRAWNAELGRMEIHGCPYFSVFRHQGHYPRVADRALDPLRQAEQRAVPRRKAPHLVAGQEVRFPDAGFDGLVGKVQQSKGRYVMVLFPGLAIPVQIEAYRLLPAKTAA